MTIEDIRIGSCCEHARTMHDGDEHDRRCNVTMPDGTRCPCWHYVESWRAKTPDDFPHEEDGGGEVWVEAPDDVIYESVSTTPPRAMRAIDTSRLSKIAHAMREAADIFQDAGNPAWSVQLRADADVLEPPPALTSKYAHTNIHTAKCCVLHGCYYGESDCPVRTEVDVQDSLCIKCSDSYSIDREQLIALRDLMLLANGRTHERLRELHKGAVVSVLSPLIADARKISTLEHHIAMKKQRTESSETP
jgi:hypothetical protein